VAFNPVDVNQVKDRTDIVSTIGRYVELKRSGTSLKGLCPFHREKTPSFFVFPASGTWKCFGCSAGGDVISFLMHYRNLNFLEVVEELADESGIPLKKTGESHVGFNTSAGLYEILEEAQRFFKKCFNEASGKHARDYLAERSVSEENLNMGIGFAPAGNALLAHLLKLGYSISVMNEAGLVITDRSEPCDRFRNRLTFPVKDRRGRVVSFGARAMGDAVPKYLNGPETSVYSKGSFLYGYSTAQEGARESGKVILVEGYFDHARLVSAGFPGTVATCGTALTEKQARNLTFMSDNICICYDGDKAGRKAAVRSAEILLSLGCYPRIVHLPLDMDPDDFVKKRGKEAFAQLLNSALDPISFCITLLGGSIPDGSGRIAATRRLLEVVASASNSLVEEDLQTKVEKFSGFSRTALAKTSDEIKKSRIPLYGAGRKSAGEISSGDRGILRAATTGGRLDGELIRFLRDDDMTSELAVKILQVFRKQLDQGYSSLVFGEMPEELAGECAGISGVLSSVSTVEIKKLMTDVEKKRREIPRRLELRKGLSGADAEQKAITLEELADGGSLHGR
jgi:DNA primase